MSSKHSEEYGNNRYITSNLFCIAWLPSTKMHTTFQQRFCITELEKHQDEGYEVDIVP